MMRNAVLTLVLVGLLSVWIADSRGWIGEDNSGTTQSTSQIASASFEPTALPTPTVRAAVGYTATATRPLPTTIPRMPADTPVVSDTFEASGAETNELPYWCSAANCRVPTTGSCRS